MSHHWYNEWLDKVEIGIHCHNHHHTLAFESQVVTNAAIDPHPLFTPRSSVFGLIQAFHSSLTHPMSHHEHDEWSYKFDIGIHHV